MAKHCFVIMPFKQAGTPEYAHFRALFDNVLKPTIEKFGYSVSRADDHKRVGSITRDIIIPLANAELVIADLTEVNPNVFYELGVRHALRGYGTIMIMDESQTEIPFDVTAYRVIKFKSTLEGIGLLGSELSAYVQQLETDPAAAVRDNLVHDWLPSLPTNVLQNSLGSEEGSLRKQIQELRKTLATYEERFGSVSTGKEAASTSPLQLVADALAEAKAGHVASKLVVRATEAAERGDTAEFLTVLSTILQLRTSRPSTRHLMELLRATTVLGLDTVEEALIEHSQKLYPNNREFRLVQFQSLAHSANPTSRALARNGMLDDLGIQATVHGYTLSRRWSESLDFGLLGLMLDAFHQDDLHDEAVRILERVKDEYPDNALVLRNYARALGEIGKKEECLEFHRQSLLLPDADDTAAVWFGNELYNRKQHVDAAEAYLVGAIKDPDDGRSLVHFADAVSLVHASAGSHTQVGARNLPQSLGDERPVVAAALIAALSIGGLTPDFIQRARTAAKRTDMDIEDLGGALPEGEPLPTSRVLRAQFVLTMYEHFRSKLTSTSSRH